MDVKLNSALLELRDWCKKWDCMIQGGRLLIDLDGGGFGPIYAEVDFTKFHAQSRLVEVVHREYLEEEE